MENGEAQAIALSEKIQEQDPEKNVWRVEMSTEEDFKVRWNRMEHTKMKAK